MNHSMSPQEFEDKGIEEVKKLDYLKEFSSYKDNPKQGVDLVCFSKDDTTEYMFDFKLINLISLGHIGQFASLAKVLPKVKKQRKLILITTGHISNRKWVHVRANNIEVWKATVSKSQSIQLTPISPPLNVSGAGTTDQTMVMKVTTAEDILFNRLKIIPSGGGKDAYIFQKVCADIFEHLFTPPLQSPDYETPDESKRNRRDFIMGNTTYENDFWRYLRSEYKAHYIVADSKNYKDFLKKQPVVDIAHYLNSYGCGLFGILISRKGASTVAKGIRREKWLMEKKMILFLSDDDLIEMLNLKKAGKPPEEVLRKKIDDFRKKLSVAF